MWGDNEFNSTFSSPNANAGKDNKKVLPKHVVPVTAFIINQCTHVENESSIFELNHLKFNQICFVGLIKSVIKRANDITYLIDDMTSTDINVKLQSDEQDDMDTEEGRPAQSQFMENQYVKVHGIIKSLQGQKIVQAFNIRPLKDLNELTNHMLECMNASIHYFTKGDSIEMSSHTNTGTRPAISNNGGPSTAGLSSLQEKVSQFMKQCKTSQGYHLNEVCANFPNIPRAQVKEALDFLNSEGHLYSTVDDEHYKSTDSYHTD